MKSRIKAKIFTNRKELILSKLTERLYTEATYDKEFQNQLSKYTARDTASSFRNRDLDKTIISCLYRGYLIGKGWYERDEWEENEAYQKKIRKGQSKYIQYYYMKKGKRTLTHGCIANLDLNASRDDAMKRAKEGLQIASWKSGKEICGFDVRVIPGKRYTLRMLDKESTIIYSYTSIKE